MADAINNRFPLSFFTSSRCGASLVTFASDLGWPVNPLEWPKVVVVVKDEVLAGRYQQVSLGKDGSNYRRQDGPFSPELTVFND